MFDFFFRKPKGITPLQPIPFIKTDLKALPLTTDLLVWFGWGIRHIIFN